MTEQNKSIYYPPGGILIWIIVFVEMITFFMGIGSLLYEKRNSYSDFMVMQSALNVPFGLWNTFFLITSGFLMANAVHFHKYNQRKSMSWSLLFAIFFGIFFIILKFAEYAGKWKAGYTIHFNDFFAYYWLLTGFHFIHVLVGIIILVYIYFIKDNILLENLEAGASFWHMCDLIWIILFPSLYLIR